VPPLRPQHLLLFHALARLRPGRPTAAGTPSGRFHRGWRKTWLHAPSRSRMLGTRTAGPSGRHRAAGAHPWFRDERLPRTNGAAINRLTRHRRRRRLGNSGARARRRSRHGRTRRGELFRQIGTRRNHWSRDRLSGKRPVWRRLLRLRGSARLLRRLRSLRRHLRALRHGRTRRRRSRRARSGPRALGRSRRERLSRTGKNLSGTRRRAGRAWNRFGGRSGRPAGGNHGRRRRLRRRSLRRLHCGGGSRCSRDLSRGRRGHGARTFRTRHVAANRRMNRFAGERRPYRRRVRSRGVGRPLRRRFGSGLGRDRR
jgi:hypothetical protein